MFTFSTCSEKSCWENFSIKPNCGVSFSDPAAWASWIHHSRQNKWINKKQIKDIIHIMSESVRAEEGPTWVRQSSGDHRRTEKDKTSIRTHIVQNSASGTEGSIDTI